MLVLEDELAEENLDRDMASIASARKNEFDADCCIAGASADNERERQHPYAARLGLRQMLALGVSPSAVVSALLPPSAPERTLQASGQGQAIVRPRGRPTLLLRACTIYALGGERREPAAEDKLCVPVPRQAHTAHVRTCAT